MDDTKDQHTVFEQIRSNKNALTPQTLCSQERSKMLEGFVTHVFSLQFEDQPNYDLLRHELNQILQRHGFDLTNEFDWSAPMHYIP